MHRAAPARGRHPYNMRMQELTHSCLRPKSGTPNLTAFIKIIQALMGYTTDDAYVALNTLQAAMNLLRYLLRYKWLMLDKEWILWILSSLTYYGKYIIQPKRSKFALLWPPSPPRTPALHWSFGVIGIFGPCGFPPLFFPSLPSPFLPLPSCKLSRRDRIMVHFRENSTFTL